MIHMFGLFLNPSQPHICKINGFIIRKMYISEHRQPVGREELLCLLAHLHLRFLLRLQRFFSSFFLEHLFIGHQMMNILIAMFFIYFQCKQYKKKIPALPETKPLATDSRLQDQVPRTSQLRMHVESQAHSPWAPGRLAG